MEIDIYLEGERDWVNRTEQNRIEQIKRIALRR